MQIFFTHHDPRKAAQYLFLKDKRRAQKQLLEGIQLLNNCCLELDILKEPRPKTKAGIFYAGRNFPKIFQQWLLRCQGNLFWFELFLRELDCLLGEPASVWPIDKYNNIESCYAIMDRIPPGHRTGFPNYAKSTAKNLDFTQIKPTTLAYQMYLREQLENEHYATTNTKL